MMDQTFGDLLSESASAMPAKPEPFTREQLSRVRKDAGSDIRALWSLLEERYALSPRECADCLSATLELPVVWIPQLERLEPDFASLSYTEASRRLCLVMHANVADKTDDEKSPHHLVALSNPFDTALQTWLASRLSGEIEWTLIHPGELLAYFVLQEERLNAMDDALADVDGKDAAKIAGADQLSLVTIAQDRSPIVRLVNSTIFDAMKAQASDIHIEMIAQGLQVKYRIDGVLSGAAEVQGRDTANQVVSRIKVMADLDIAEQRIPQDGRFKLTIQGRDIDFRVSVMPSLFGEDIVIRILDKRSLSGQVQGLRLDLLGFEGDILEQIRELASEPYGMLLVTGPTGSGKTTTLYAALSEINSGDSKIVTIEDPIEYELPGILQIPVNEKKGLGFARGLRSILRHDPDKIFVGEIRDPETAQIAIQSALTGHLVFTSVHANNVFDVLGRFVHLGVDTYSFVSALNGVLAQRLIRVICPHCREVDANAISKSKGTTRVRLLQAGKELYRGKGCGQCRGTGYKGRRTISELLLMDDEIREMIISRLPIRSIKEKAQVNGTVFLRDSAIAAVLAGWTTIDEINRVTFAK